MKKEIAKRLSGKELAEQILLSLREKIIKAEKNGKRPPSLAVFMAGNDPASALYVRTKKKTAHKLGIIFHDYCCNSKDEKELLESIDFINKDESVDGIMAQLPLPKGFNTDKIIKLIDPRKDVDGFHPDNLKKFEAGNISLLETRAIMPPTLKAVIALLDSIGEELGGKTAAIISRNEIFADPLKAMLNLKDIKTEIAHTEDKKISGILKKSGIVIIAIGSPDFLKGDMIKDDVIIIDVGTTLIDEKLFGDVDFKSCAKKAFYISPVPGGVGPLTVAYLLENVVNAWEKNI
ncbi:MAG: bifunctional 5,10-methylenetetrahydrofolate dehydrogenase/5,10-methenyltetrahydrofolate cyclohydrolase [bacterium]